MVSNSMTQWYTILLQEHVYFEMNDSEFSGILKHKETELRIR